MWQIIGMMLALLAGLYIGFGSPGLPGREDRVVKKRGRRVHRFTPLDLLRPRKR